MPRRAPCCAAQCAGGTGVAQQGEPIHPGGQARRQRAVEGVAGAGRNPQPRQQRSAACRSAPCCEIVRPCAMVTTAAGEYVRVWADTLFGSWRAKEIGGQSARMQPPRCSAAAVRRCLRSPCRRPAQLVCHVPPPKRRRPGQLSLMTVKEYHSGGVVVKSYVSRSQPVGVPGVVDDRACAIRLDKDG